MLSKVMKGDRAARVAVMTFGEAVPAINELRRPPSGAQPSSGDVDHGGRGEDQAELVAKIRTLEASLAAAKREAFEAGRQQGEQEARAAVAPVLERLKTSIAEVVNMRPDLRRRAEKDAVELSLQIAQRILHRELSIDGNALNALARVVFDRLTRTESWHLTVHPQFAEAIRGSLPAGSNRKVNIEADPACAPGTFLVRCADGAIDASVDSQLAEISRGLTDRLTQR